MRTRTERDFLGEVRVPADAYYGIQTARAVENFPISGLKTHSVMIRPWPWLKRSQQVFACVEDKPKVARQRNEKAALFIPA